MELIILEFRCHECGYRKTITNYDDPTTSTGCCFGCGGTRWNIYDWSNNKVV